MKKLIWVFVLVLFIAGLSGAASITVTKPALNEPWTKGQTYAITWTKTGSMPNNVRISLRNKTSTAVVQEIVDPAPNTGTYMWTVPASIPEEEYCIRVRVKTTDISDDSEVFTISASQQPPPPKYPRALALTKIKPFLKVTQPAGEASCRNGEHLFIRVGTNFVANEKLEIDLYDESMTAWRSDIYSGLYGAGTAMPPAGAAYANQYVYDWVVPFLFIQPGYFKIRVFAPEKNLTAWSGRVYITWPMREKEYYLDPNRINQAFCVNNTDGLTPYPVRPKCENYSYPPIHAFVGYDIFQYAGTLSAEGEPYPAWRIYMRHAQLIFPIEQFQGEQVELVQAKLILKKICTVNVNSSLASCADRLYRLDAPLPAATSGAPCLDTKKTALVFLPNDLTEKSVDVTQTVDYWIKRIIRHNGFLLAIADETPTPPYTATTCISSYSAQLYLKIKEVYFGHD
jgi:hypothetical protein